MLNPEVCARCAQKGPTCCQLAPGQEEFCLPLSEAEINVIMRRLPGVSAEAIFSPTPNSAAFMDRLNRMFPAAQTAIGQLFPQNRQHLRLITDDKGRCVFLTDSGCALPRDSRPIFCRLFPFWPANGRFQIFAYDNCLAQKEFSTLEGLMAALGTTPSTLTVLYNQLLHAWGLDVHAGLPTALAGRWAVEPPGSPHHPLIKWPH